MAFLMSDTTNRYKSLHQLNPSQSRALDLLDQGSTHAEVADAVTVDRTTITRWANSHPAFVAELNRRKSERAELSRIRIAEVTDRALKALIEAIDGGDTRTAVEWLKLTNVVVHISAKSGPTSSKAVIEARRRQLPELGGPEEALDQMSGRTLERALETIADELAEGEA